MKGRQLKTRVTYEQIIILSLILKPKRASVFSVDTTHLCSRQANTLSAITLVPVMRNVKGRFARAVVRNLSQSLSGIMLCAFKRMFIIHVISYTLHYVPCSTSQRVDFLSLCLYILFHFHMVLTLLLKIWDPKLI